MNRSKWITFCTAVAILTLLGGAAPVSAQDQSKPAQSQQKPPQMSPEEQAQMQAMMQAAMPGPVHKQMAKRAGEYTVTTKFEMPGAPASESMGTAKITAVLDGRFLLEENTGTSMGMPIAGMRLYGYNNAAKKYEAVWVYTMSTGTLPLTGTSNDDGKTVNYTGTVDNGSGGKETLNITVHQVDDDHFLVRLSAEGPGAGAVLEETYTRKK
jgi:hypothetical protein